MPPSLAPARHARLAAAAAAVMGLVAAMVLAQTLAESFATHTPLPQEDEWWSLVVYRSVLDGAHVFADLASQHNEHRILFPRLVLFADYLFFGGEGFFDLASIFTIQALLAGLFFFLIRRTVTNALAQVALGALVVLLLFSLRQSENFVWGFQVQFVGVFAAGCLAAVLHAAALDPARAGGPSRRLLAGAFGAAAVATFSMSNGMLAGLVLVLTAMVARAGWRQVLLAAGVSAALIVAFFHGYEMLNGENLRSAWISRPWIVPLYAAAYLGNFLDGDIDGAVALGLFGLAAMALLAARAATGRDRHAGRIGLLGIMLFVAASAALTALGRSADGLDTAMASRYATGAACFWSALGISAWSAAEDLRERAGIRLLVACTGLLLVMAVIWTQAPTIAFLEDRAVRQNVIADALLLGIVDEAAVSAMDDDPDHVRGLLPFLRERRIAIFATADAARVGQTLDQAGLGIGEPCPDLFTVEPAKALGQEVLRVGGEIGVVRRWPASTRIYVVDSSDHIVGLGSARYDEPPWSGYASAPPGTVLRAFARLGSGRLCETGETRVPAPGAAAAAPPAP